MLRKVAYVHPKLSFHQALKRPFAQSITSLRMSNTACIILFFKGTPALFLMWTLCLALVQAYNPTRPYRQFIDTMGTNSLVARCRCFANCIVLNSKIVGFHIMPSPNFSFLQCNWRRNWTTRNNARATSHILRLNVTESRVTWEHQCKNYFRARNCNNKRNVLPAYQPFQSTRYFEAFIHVPFD